MTPATITRITRNLPDTAPSPLSLTRATVRPVHFQRGGFGHVPTAQIADAIRQGRGV